ncbi:MAG: sensor histidine kinase [Thermodesulfobacteriota bacterium]|nr:sensor histidine kinase [Thermodesulfobacteriota bacterium]
MTITELLITLFKNFGIIAAAAFLLLSWGAFRKLVLKETTLKDKFVLILFFGTFGILGTYVGVPVEGGIANLRAMAVITAGLFGGPVVGIGAGLITGGHRILIDIGGFTCIPCGLSTFLEGMAAGLISVRLKEKESVLNWRLAVVIGLAGETIHMLIVLALARPFENALHLVEIISFPMILLNSLGAGLFVEIIRSVLKGREKRASIQAQKALNIANLTVSHLRSGLNLETAGATAKIIFDNISVAAVSITDIDRILAFIGAGDDHHKAGQKIQTKSTKVVVDTGKPLFIKNKGRIGCDVADCPLQSAIIVPLKKSGNIIGALKLYGDKKIPLNRIDFQIGSGLANLFSTQLELEDIQLKTQLLAQAEIKRLQSQIKPHFLFNSLNTITSFCRTDPEKARDLLINFSSYLRKSLENHKNFVTVADELQQVKSYLAIEKARFGERIKFTMDIEPGYDQWPIPPLIIQPLVENSVKHGISVKEEGGSVSVVISKHNKELQIIVQDDGIGMDGKQSENIFNKSSINNNSPGIGLKNINKRMEQIYGPQYKLVMNTKQDSGTTVKLIVPMVNSDILN